MTKIEWADMTINPVVGCSHCSPGCDNCYAERFAARLAKHPNPKISGKYTGTVDENGKWTGKIATDLSCLAKLPSKPRHIFVGSMCDLFHPATEYRYLDTLFAATIFYPQHTFLLLTKRPENMRRYISGLRPAEANESNDSTYTQSVIWPELLCDRQWRFMSDIPGWGLLNRRVPANEHWPLNNVWLGVTVCNQEEADAKIPLLLQTPAAVRFVSIEPMLGPVDLFDHLFSEYDKACMDIQMMHPHAYSHEKINWIICGGETGPGARPMHPNWVRSLRDQCQHANTPFFFKGWGGWMPSEVNSCGRIGTWFNGQFLDNYGNIEEPGLNMSRAKSKVYGQRLLDGVEYSAIPEVKSERGKDKNE